MCKACTLTNAAILACKLFILASGKIDFTTGVFISVQLWTPSALPYRLHSKQGYLAHGLVYPLAVETATDSSASRMTPYSLSIALRNSVFAFSGLATAMRMASRILNELANFIQES